MNSTFRSILIMGITFAIIICIFWFVIPLTNIPDQLGSSYIVVALLGSLAISYGVSWILGNLIKPSKK